MNFAFARAQNSLNATLAVKADLTARPGLIYNGASLEAPETRVNYDDTAPRALHPLSTVPCTGPIEAPEGGLRASSDGDTWEFAIVPGDHTEIYDQHWTFNGLSPDTPNTDPGWGTFGGGDGANSFSWISPTEGGTYTITVKAKRKCTLTGEGGGGAAVDPNFEISWGVEVDAAKTWDVGSAISATLSATGHTNNKVAPGDSVTCTAAATDSDHWRKGEAPDAEQGDEDDSLTYEWSATGGFISGSGTSATWTPPSEAGTYTITCKVNDLPKEIASIDIGTRDDTNEAVATISFEVPPRTWSAGMAIGRVLDDKGRLLDKNHQPITSDSQVPAENGRLIAPQNRTKALPPGETEWPVVKVHPEDEVSCAVEDATDFDHWNRPGLDGTDNKSGNYPENTGKYALDHYGRTLGDEGDELTYTWSAGVGTFKNGKHTGAAVTWIAPKVGDPGFDPDQEYTIECVIDDAPKSVAAPDAPVGDTARGDNALHRSFTVKVVDDTSWLKLKLYKDEGQDVSNGGDPGAEVEDVAGGALKVAVEVQVGGLMQIVSPPTEDAQQNIIGSGFRLRFSEQDGLGLHDDSDNHIYKDALPTRWWKWNRDENKWETTTESPLSANTTNEPKRFRGWIDWNTTSEQTCSDPDGADQNSSGPLTAGKLWGHNASHGVEFEYSVKEGGQWQVKREVEFNATDDPDAAPKASEPNSIGVEIGNLVITNVMTNANNSDYIRFIPDSDDETLAQPKIHFTIEDKGDPHAYRWYIYIRDTKAEDWNVEGMNYAVVDGLAPAPGEVPPIAWDGIYENGESAPKGTYTFDILVYEIPDIITAAPPILDAERLKRKPAEDYKLKIPPKMPGEYVDDEQRDGHYVEFGQNIESGDPLARVGYYLEDADGLDASLEGVEKVY